jgi:hypothetical protein
MSDREGGQHYELHTLDIAVITCYFIALLSIAFVPAVWACLPRRWTRAVMKVSRCT